jgi:CubicO group peptidase (beta-lactamase class C family)
VTTTERFVAQESKTGGLSPSRLANMHAIMRRHVETRRLPGLVVAVSRRGAQHVDEIGTLAFDRTTPMRRDTIFRLASVTKPIAAVAMILLEECKLRLDDPVDEILSELANRKVLRAIDSELDDTVPAKRPITVRDLLTYRSGYGEVAFLSPMCPLQRALIEARLPLSAWMFPGTADELTQCLGRLPLAHRPGERRLYHMSAEILGILIAGASGMSLSSFMSERIFHPLVMNDTGFTVTGGKARPRRRLLQDRPFERRDHGPRGGSRRSAHAAVRVRVGRRRSVRLHGRRSALLNQGHTARRGSCRGCRWSS